MDKREYEEKKRALLRYRHLVRRLEQTCREAGQWASMALGAGCDLLPDQRRGRGSVIVTAATLQQEVEQLGERTVQLRKLLMEAISQLPSEMERELMEARYVAGMTVKQIGETYGYTPRHINRLLETATMALPWPPQKMS